MYYAIEIVPLFEGKKPTVVVRKSLPGKVREEWHDGTLVGRTEWEEWYAHPFESPRDAALCSREIAEAFRYA